MYWSHRGVMCATKLYPVHFYIYALFIRAQDVLKARVVVVVVVVGIYYHVGCTFYISRQSCFGNSSLFFTD